MKLLLYCTKANSYLYGMYSGFESKYGYHLTNDKKVFEQHNVLNGKIVAECDFEVEEISIEKCLVAENYTTNTMDMNKLLKCSCLTEHELINYEPKYAIHIKNLHIFDEPKELYDYSTDFPIYPIVKAPQNMMYCYGENIGDKYILISIRPEWLCKILNGEKTIEVRKKVLKEMLE